MAAYVLSGLPAVRKLTFYYEEESEEDDGSDEEENAEDDDGDDNYYSSFIYEEDEIQYAKGSRHALPTRGIALQPSG
jgi:hypothetical protein